MIEPAVSPSRSFKGWLFSVWLAKNKAWVKAPLVLFFAWLTWALAPISSPELKALLTAVVTVVGRFAVDAFDYYVTEVTLS